MKRRCVCRPRRARTELGAPKMGLQGAFWLGVVASLAANVITIGITELVARSRRKSTA